MKETRETCSVELVKTINVTEQSKYLDDADRLLVWLIFHVGDEGDDFLQSVLVITARLVLLSDWTRLYEASLCVHRPT